MLFDAFLDELLTATHSLGNKVARDILEEFVCLYVCSCEKNKKNHKHRKGCKMPELVAQMALQGILDYRFETGQEIRFIELSEDKMKWCLIVYPMINDEGNPALIKMIMQFLRKKYLQKRRAAADASPAFVHATRYGSVESHNLESLPINETEEETTFMLIQTSLSSLWDLFQIIQVLQGQKEIIGAHRSFDGFNRPKEDFDEDKVKI